MADQYSLLDAQAILSSINNNSVSEQRECNRFIPAALPPGWKNASGPEHSPRTSGECMYQYCFYKLMYSPGENQDRNMQEMLSLYGRFERTPDKKKKDKILADAWLEVASELLDEALQQDHPPAELLEKIKKMGDPLYYAYKKKRDKASNDKQRKAVSEAHRVQIAAPAVQQQMRQTAPVLTVPTGSPYHCPSYASHPNDIFTLKPAQEWHLYIDESGKEPDFVTGGRGIFAAVLEDAAHPLPAFQPLHASTDATEELICEGDKVIKTLLTHPQTGVLAVPVRAYRNGAAWGSLIISCIDLVLRLLPLNSTKTKLKVFVEARDPYRTEKDFIMMRDACRYQLMHTLPERAGLIDFEICEMDKKHPCNAYPDLVAHTCFTHRGNAVAKQRFEIAGWDGTCFLNYDAMQLCNLLDFFHLGRTLSVADWNELVQKTAPNHNNFVAALLQSFGEELRQDVGLWKTFLDYFVDHLNSKAINIVRLQKQALFLKEYQPATEKLPPRLQLLWLTAVLAESNHRGSVAMATLDEFNSLIRSLYEEDAPLTCWATLHLAVNYTNAFDFRKAKELTANYLAMLQQNQQPAAIPGLQYYAQLLSSLGQHEAFLGNDSAAIKHFREALLLFDRLSTGGGQDKVQTGTYLMTSLVDSKDIPPDTLKQVAAWYFGSNLEQTIETIVTGCADAEKYRQHLIFRWLVSEKAPQGLKEKVLALKEKWLCGIGHPWELIEFYRALLSKNQQERILHLKKAHELSQGYDATLHMIDAVILGALLLDDPSVLPEYKKLLEQCSAELPAAQDRIAILKEQPTKKRPPLELAAKVLPFNFR